MCAALCTFWRRREVYLIIGRIKKLSISFEVLRNILNYVSLWMCLLTPCVREECSRADCRLNLPSVYMEEYQLSELRYFIWTEVYALHSLEM